MYFGKTKHISLINSRIFYVTFHAVIRLLLVFDITLDMSSVKHSGTRQLATLLVVSSGILGMIEVLSVIFMTPYLVHLLPVFVCVLRDVSGDLCVAFLKFCKCVFS